MPASDMIKMVTGAAMVATAMACSDMLVADPQEYGIDGSEELQESNQEPERQEHGSWSDNEPAGMTPIVVVDGSSKYWPGFRQAGAWLDAARVAVVDDPESKHGKAVEKRFFSGDQSGWHGITYRGDFGANEELYFRMVFRLSSNWQYHSGMNKLFYWGSAERPTYRSPTQFYLGIRGGRFEFVNQSSSGELDARGNFRANAPAISLNQYHTLEVLHTANTRGTSNGSARMWIDGVEVQSFDQLGASQRAGVRLENLRWLDYSDPRLTGLQAIMFWGGQGDTKRVNDWIRLSELYVSGKNVNSAVGGGDEPRDQTLTGNWSISATGGHSASGTTCEVEGVADLIQGGTKFNGSIVGTITCSWPDRSAEWEFDDSVVGSIDGDDVVFDMAESDGHASGTASGSSMSGTVTWKVDTGRRMGVIALTGNWSAVRQ